MKLPVALVLAVAFAGCGAPPDQLLSDPGFEAGGDAWFWFEGHEHWPNPFDVGDTHVRSGSFAARTLLTTSDQHPDVAVVGAIQEIKALDNNGRIPARLAGHYYVADWQSNADKAYLQVVVSLFPKDDPARWCAGVAPHVPCQMAFVLGGIDERPLPLGNRLYVLPTDDAVIQDQWVAFDYDLRDLFETQWQVERPSYDHLWVYLEVRYEHDEPGHPEVLLDAWWDDIHVGA